MTPRVRDAVIVWQEENDEGFWSVTVSMSDGASETSQFSSDWSVQEIVGRLIAGFGMKRDDISIKGAVHGDLSWAGL